MTDRPSAHPDDPHYVDRMSWLRAAVMGANDGIVSVGGLITGVAAASPDPKTILIAGSAGLVAGAMSMAAGEYVSVSSQSDIERSDIARECFGEDVHHHILTMAKAEWMAFNQTVTDWELRRYWERI